MTGRVDEDELGDNAKWQIAGECCPNCGHAIADTEYTGTLIPSRRTVPIGWNTFRYVDEPYMVYRHTDCQAAKAKRAAYVSGRQHKLEHECKGV